MSLYIYLISVNLGFKRLQEDNEISDFPESLVRES